jgi:hypothetical protein
MRDSAALRLTAAQKGGSRVTLGVLPRWFARCDDRARKHPSRQQELSMSSPTLPSPRRVLTGRSAAIGLGLAVAGAGVAHAAAAAKTYVVSSFVEPARPGLAVTGPLGKTFVAVEGARVVVPGNWQKLSAPAGKVRFLGPRSTSCRYRIAFTAKSRLAAPADPVAYVTAALPAASAPYLLDSGVHGTRAFRVVRRRTAGQVRVDALFATVLTRRADIAPAGQVAWGEIHVVATSRPGDECHSGTYRQTLGPQIGDALATARVRLRFVRPAG